MSATDQFERGITLINMFTVTPEKQNTAADKIAHIYQTFVCNQPGFISPSRPSDRCKTLSVSATRFSHLRSCHF